MPVAEPQSVAGSSEFAPPDCAVCERSLLVGERLRVYRDRERRLVKVCELCRDAALARDWEQMGPVDTPRLQVQPSGSVSDIVDRDALIAGLGQELSYLREQLGAAHSALSEHTLQSDTVRAITDKLRRQDRELERLRREAHPAQRAHEQRVLARQTEELTQLREMLLDRDNQIQRLLLAREAESSTIRMCRFALDTFNDSEHADRMVRIARTLDAPTVSVIDEGPGIPRKVYITLVWDVAWYEFCVKLDLGRGIASVHQLKHGGDPRALSDEQRRSDAQWRESGLVLQHATE